MISSISHLVELITIFYCFSLVYERKMKFSFQTIVFIIIDWCILFVINEYGYPAYLLTLVYIGMFAYCLIHYRLSIRSTIVNCILSVIVVGVLQLIINIPIFYIFIKDKGADIVGGLLINIVSLSVLCLLGKRLRLAEVSRFFTSRNRILVMILAFMTIYLGMNIFQIKEEHFVGGEDYVQIILFIVLFFLSINEWQKSKFESERKSIQIEMSKLYYDTFEELLNLVRERQHDMMNHINAIYGMIYTSDNYDELVQRQKQYCDHIVENNRETHLLLSAGNPLLAGFLYTKKQEAEKLGIKVQCELRFDNKSLANKEYEIIEMIGIVLDNAIEALKTIINTERKIYIKINSNEKNINILVANTSRFYKSEEIQQFFRKNYTNKGIGRGIGLKKLKKMVECMSGEISVSNESYNTMNCLEFEIILPAN